MKIYLSSITFRIVEEFKKKFPNKKINVLRSFGIPSNQERKFLITHRNIIGSIIQDSGTWTMNQRKKDGMRITREGYQGYMKMFGHHFDFYFNFDSNYQDIGFEENLEHLEKLEEAGLKPVPVVHDYYGGEIDYYLKLGYDMVALGSILDVESDRSKRTNADIKHAVQRLKQGNPKIKIHLFGSGSYDAMANLPLYSSDSSSWAQNSRYGYILYWNPSKLTTNKTVKLYFYDTKDDPRKNRRYFETYEFRKELETYLDRTLGITYTMLMGSNFHLYRNLVNTLYFVELEEILTAEHKRQGFIE